MASELQIRLKIITESRRDKNKIDGLPRLAAYAVQEIRQRIIDKKIIASGRTNRSLSYTIDGEKAMRIIATAGDRAPISTLQWGRPGGKVPKGFNNIIRQWIIDKGLSYKAIAYKRKASANWKPKYTPEERGLTALAGAIANKIAAEGTGRHRNPEPEVYSPVLEEVIDLFTNFIASKTEQIIVKTLMK